MLIVVISYINWINFNFQLKIFKIKILIFKIFYLLQQIGHLPCKIFNFTNLIYVNLIFKFDDVNYKKLNLFDHDKMLFFKMAVKQRPIPFLWNTLYINSN